MTQFVNPPFTSGTLTTIPRDPILDLDQQIGQRAATYRFARTNGLTGEVLGDVHPIRSATLTHDTTRTIKRQLNISFGVEDSAIIEPLTDRIAVFMVFADGTEYPLGRYMFSDPSNQLYTAGVLSNVLLNDEMFLVDQQIQAGINGVGQNVVDTIYDAVAGLPITTRAEYSPFITTQAWSTGSSLGQVLESLSLTGDFFSPWFDNVGELRFIRAFDPATKIPDFDFDTGFKVYRASVVDSSNILTAPNRFIVISNAATDTASEIVGIADIPPTAPYSFARRGFYITQVETLQIADTAQASAVAQNLATRKTVFEQMRMSTAPDPRHDSYNVIRWQGTNWLELSWSMTLVEGAPMNHLMRKAYG